MGNAKINDKAVSGHLHGLVLGHLQDVATRKIKATKLVEDMDLPMASDAANEKIKDKADVGTRKIESIKLVEDQQTISVALVESDAASSVKVLQQRAVPKSQDDAEHLH